MKKIATGIVAGLLCSAVFGAALNEGTRELGVTANVRRDAVAGAVSFGQFIVDGLLLGVNVNGMHEDFGKLAASDNGEAVTYEGSLKFQSYGANLFAQYHFDLDNIFVPFVGLATGVQYAKLELPAAGSQSDTGWLGEAQVGVKTFVVNNVALVTYGFFAHADERIFSDKDAKMRKNDWGLRLGLNYYF